MQAPAGGRREVHGPRRPRGALPRAAEGRAADVDARDSLHGTRHSRPDRLDELRSPPRESGRALLQHPLARPVRPLADRPASLLRPTHQAEVVRERRHEGSPCGPAARDLRGPPAKPMVKPPSPGLAGFDSVKGACRPIVRVTYMRTTRLVTSIQSGPRSLSYRLWSPIQTIRTWEPSGGRLATVYRARQPSGSSRRKRFGRSRYRLGIRSR